MRFFSKSEEALFDTFCQLADKVPLIGKGEGIQLHAREGVDCFYRMTKIGGKLTFEVVPKT